MIWLALAAVLYLVVGALFCGVIHPAHDVRPRGYAATVFGWPYIVWSEGTPRGARFVRWATYH